MPTKEDAIAALKEVEDPELKLDIYTLGLIYDIKITDENVLIVMTLTSPMCPFGPQIITNAAEKLKEKGFKEAKVDLTFSPPWEPSDEVKMELGLL